jgi:hypothetical protein
LKVLNNKEIEIKKAARLCYNNKNFDKAFEILKQLGSDGFIYFALHPDKKKKRDSWFRNQSFFKNIMSDEEFLDDIFQSKYFDQMIHSYYTGKDYSFEFELQFAKKYPEKFVQSVRVNQSFLDNDRLKFYSKVNLPEELKIHQTVWQFLKNRENNIWLDSKNLLERITELSVEEILVNIILWLEEFRFNDNSAHTLAILANSYSTSITLILEATLGEKSHAISSDTFFQIYIKYLFRKKIDNNIREYLNKVSDWECFKHDTLYPYCYDSTIKPYIKNGNIYFGRSPEDYYKWELDGKRYEINKIKYSLDAEELVNVLISKNILNIPKGKDEDHFHKNLILNIHLQQIGLFLNDLKIDYLVFGGKNISVRNLFTPLFSFTYNRNIRYEHSLQNFNSNSSDVFDSLKEMQLESFESNILNLPYFLMSEIDYIKHINNSISNESEKYPEELIDLFSYTINNGHSRNTKYYDVWKKPFIKLRDKLFCPMLIFATNDWFYAFVQASLENYSNPFAIGQRKNSATEMEKYLTELFRNKKMNANLVSDEQANKIDGDVDLIVSEGDVSLLIQLKRTAFRLDLKEAYLESVNSERKAINQLNDAERFLLKNNTIKIGKIVRKWIVTTSFENISSIIDGCYKINYFDLISALSDPDIKSLNTLIIYCENDYRIRKIFKYSSDPFVNLIFKSMNLPLPLRDPSAYNEKVCVIEKDNKIEQLFDKAKNADKKGKKKTAVKILDQCFRLNPNDYELWSYQANIYADMKEYKNSFLCFEKALSLIPDDPFILRNYALALIESGDKNSGLKIIEELVKKYWFVNFNLDYIPDVSGGAEN